MRFHCGFGKIPYEYFLLTDLHIRFSQYTFAAENHIPEY
jgi:hypothetical protein